MKHFSPLMYITVSQILKFLNKYLIFVLMYWHYNNVNIA